MMIESLVDGESQFMASHGLLQEDPPSNEATEEALSEQCRDEEMNGNRQTWHGFSQPLSAVSYDNK